jgi:hypothetical protein
VRRNAWFPAGNGFGGSTEDDEDNGDQEEDRSDFEPDSDVSLADAINDKPSNDQSTSLWIHVGEKLSFSRKLAGAPTSRRFVRSQGCAV